MRIGLCSSDFTTPTPCETMFKKMSEMKFKVTQFGMSSVLEIGLIPTKNIEIPWKVDGEVIKMIIKASEKYGVEITASNGTFNMAHPDPKIRNEGVERFEGFTDAAKAMGAQIISLCSGTRNPEYLWSPHPDNETDGAWNDMFETAAKITKIAEKKGLTLAVETEAANVINTPEKARKLMDDIGSHALKMIIDCANLFHIGKAHKENVRPTLKHAFEWFGKDIVSAHGKDISDSDGIDYCPTGEGIIDYPYFIQLLNEYGYKGDMYLHTLHTEDKMIKAREIFEKLI